MNTHLKGGVASWTSKDKRIILDAKRKELRHELVELATGTLTWSSLVTGVM